MAGRARGRQKRNERDLDRIAFLERLNRGGRPGDGGNPEASRHARPRGGSTYPPIARYARFRQVASLLFALALLDVLWGIVAIVLAVAALLSGEVSFFAGASRVVAWAFAATVGYGILKGLGEALLLWADVAELNNTAVEISWQRREEEARQSGT